MTGDVGLCTLNCLTFISSQPLYKEKNNVGKGFGIQEKVGKGFGIQGKRLFR